MASCAARGGEVGIRADERRQLARQRGDALHALALGAELLVEDDVELFSFARRWSSGLPAISGVA